MVRGQVFPGVLLLVGQKYVFTQIYSLHTAHCFLLRSQGLYGGADSSTSNRSWGTVLKMSRICQADVTTSWGWGGRLPYISGECEANASGTPKMLTLCSGWGKDTVPDLILWTSSQWHLC